MMPMRGALRAMGPGGLGLAAGLGLWACGEREPVILEVGEARVPLEVFELSFWEVSGKDSTIAADSTGVRQFLEIYIQKEIMESIAEDSIPAFDEELEDRWQLSREEMLMRLLDRRILKEAGRVSDREIESAYGKLTTQFHIREILLSNEDEARSVVQLIEGGAVFGKVAAQRSADPTGRASGGDRGWVTLGNISLPVYEAAEKLEAGEVSPVVRSSLGYHLIQLEGRRETPQVEPLEALRPTLEPMLQRERTAAAILAFQEGLLERYDYEVNAENVIWATNWLREYSKDVARTREALLEEHARPQLPSLSETDRSLVLAKMKGDTLTTVHLIVEVTAMPPATWPTFDSPDDALTVLRRMALTRLKLAEARRLRLDEDPNFVWLAGKRRDAMLTRQFYLRFVRPASEPAEEEIEAFYQENVESYRQAEGRRFVAVNVTDRNVADGVARRLAKGDDAEETFAWTQMADSTATWTGPQGTPFHLRGEHPLLDGVLFSLEAGKVSPPIPNLGGFTVAKLLEIRPAGTQSLEDVRTSIATYLWDRKSDELLTGWIDAVRDTIRLRVDEKAVARVRLTPPEGWITPRQAILDLTL